MNKKQVLAFSNSIFFLTILVGFAMLCIPEKALGHSQTLSSGSTFTTPHKIPSLTVQVWGAGGGGGSGNKGGGGGGGAFASITFSGSLPSSYSYQIGSGGAAGSLGGDSWFNSNTILLAKGGAGASGSTGGAGGLAASSIGITKWSGGGGASGGA